MTVDGEAPGTAPTKKVIVSVAAAPASEAVKPNAVSPSKNNSNKSNLLTENTERAEQIAAQGNNTTGMFSTLPLLPQSLRYLHKAGYTCNVASINMFVPHIPTSDVTDAKCH